MRGLGTDGILRGLPSDDFRIEMPTLPPSLLSPDLRLRLCLARELLCADDDEALSLGEIATRTGIPVTQLIRRFATTFGETPHRYRSRWRMARAAELLEREERSVTSICMSLGYSSLGSFSWKFAHAFGESPALYRRRFFPSAAIPQGPAWLHGDGCCAMLIAGLNALTQFPRSALTSPGGHSLP